MKTNNFFLKLFCALMIFSSGCNKSTKSDLQLPVADFSYTGADVPAPATVTFNNLSTNSIDYVWEFGDSTISMEKNPTHFYQTGAKYSVKLTANSGVGTSSITKVVSFTNIPVQCKIISLTLKNVPLVGPTGIHWDNGTGPDVYFTISESSNTLFNGIDSIYYDITNTSFPLNYTFLNPLTISPINSLTFITVYDYDGDNQAETIGYFAFTPSVYFSYPTNITLNNQWGLSIVLNLQWQY